jgi:hypothetical protein
VLARLGEPAFQRSPEHYTSHAQTPFERVTQYAALARSGSVALFGFPLGTSYHNQGYWIYRQAFQRLLREVLPTQLVASNAPLSAEITLTRQTSPRERYLLHIVNFSPLRQTPKHPAFLEDPIPLTDVTVRLNLPLKAATARAVLAGLTLPVRPGGEVTVPRVPVHEIVSFEV